MKIRWMIEEDERDGEECKMESRRESRQPLKRMMTWRDADKHLEPMSRATLKRVLWNTRKCDVWGCSVHIHTTALAVLESISSSSMTNLSVCWVHKPARCSLTSLPVLGCCSVHELRGKWLSYLVFPTFRCSRGKHVRSPFAASRDQIHHRLLFCCDSFFTCTFCVLFDTTSRQLVELKWLMLNKHKRWFHSSRVKFPFFGVNVFDLDFGVQLE